MSRRDLTVLDAVDNLSHMAEADVFTPQPAAEIPAEQKEALSWYSPDYATYNQERIRETFRALLKFIQDLFEKDKGHLRDLETQKGIQALMLLAAEAAQKVDNFTEIFKGESVAELKEYKELQHYYLTKVVGKFQMLTETEEKWRTEWGPGTEEEEGLRDLDSVRQDKHYELFFIRKEDGRPFFPRALLRHLHLVGQFDAAVVDPALETPFKRIPQFLDKDRHLAAKEILVLAAPYLDEFFKEALKFKHKEFASNMGKAAMALMLAANPRNLIQTAAGKSAYDYFTDYHFYLDKALSSKEYLNYVAKPPEPADRFLYAMMNLAHILSASFFLRSGTRKEMEAHIQALIEKGGVHERQTSSPLSFWNNLLDDDKSLRAYLKKFQSGPLTLALEMLKNDEELSSFKPLYEENLPAQMYAIASEDLHISCVRLPAPVIQQFVHKVEIANEFYGMLHALHRKNQRHLLFNLQERTSSLEYARCVALEEVPKHSPNRGSLIVAGMAKDGDFYRQSGSYHALSNAKEFMAQFEEQLRSGEQCGYSFPTELQEKEFMAFVREAFKTVHALFFAGNNELTVKNRLDFIEIIQLLAALKCIETFRPDSISFTCKDAIDTGAAAAAELYAFLRMMNDPSALSKEERGLLLWMLYAPALASRRRAIDMERLSRMAGALEAVGGALDAHRDETVSKLSKLFSIPFFKGLNIN